MVGLCCHFRDITYITRGSYIARLFVYVYVFFSIGRTNIFVYYLESQHHLNLPMLTSFVKCIYHSKKYQLLLVSPFHPLPCLKKMVLDINMLLFM
jgi:hypothetical protein